jgi:hypothetical protein
MDVAEFLRLYQVRARQIMWFLGAGASAAAGVPTAYHLTWEFKRAIYCAEQRISIRTAADIGDPALQARVQQYFDSQKTYPPVDAPDEYAFYFEKAYARRPMSPRRPYTMSPGSILWRLSFSAVCSGMRAMVSVPIRKPTKSLGMTTGTPSSV